MSGRYQIRRRYQGQIVRRSSVHEQTALLLGIVLALSSQSSAQRLAADVGSPTADVNRTLGQRYVEEVCRSAAHRGAA